MEKLEERGIKEMRKRWVSGEGDAALGDAEADNAIAGGWAGIYEGAAGGEYGRDGQDSGDHRGTWRELFWRL